MHRGCILYCYCLPVPHKGHSKTAKQKTHLSNHASPVKGRSTHLDLSAATRCFLSSLSSGKSDLPYLNSHTKLHSEGWRKSSIVGRDTASSINAGTISKVCNFAAGTCSGYCIL